MARHQRIRLTRGKVPIKKADTNLTTIGAGTAPGTFNILETQGGARTTTGGTQTIKSSADTGEVCNVGDLVKYVTLFIEAGARPDQTTAQDRTGWLEWALVCVKESETTVPITDLGIQTLGAVCNHMFRQECIYTGAIPVGDAQPVYAEIALKIPPTKAKITLGDEWRFITSFRAVSATSVSTGAIRLVKSFQYKCYS